MSNRPSEGIGGRIAEYRRLAGLSARELADAAGMGLTRGVVANIESGRKSDITVDQLIAIADVLGVPPVAIALPLDRPFAEVRITDGESDQRRAAVWVAARQFTGAELPEDGFAERTTPATPTAYGRWERFERYLDARAARDFLRSRPDAMPSHLEELEREVPELERELTRLGVDLSMDGDRG